MLIETLLWDGAGLVRLERHLARLARSAGVLGWGCDPVAAVAALLAAVGAGASPSLTRRGEPLIPSPAPQMRSPQGAARLRLTLDGAGRIAVTVAALPAPLSVWRLGLAQARLDAADPWLGLKSTRRGAYDAARATLAPGLDEVVFLNQRGEVCDGTITTLFFDAGAGLCTPPLRSGLLPGVLRAELLAQGRCREAVLAASDLPRVRLWVGNSLRGLSPARWAAQPR